MVHHYKLECHARKKKGLLSSGSWPQGSYNKIMTVTVDISSEFQILLLPNFVWWYSITCQTVLWKKICFVVVTAKGQKFIECLDDILWTRYLFGAKPSMVNCIIMSQIALQKDCFATIKVQARVRAHIISMWSFLLYLQSCWSFCNQTYSYSVFKAADLFATKLSLMVQHH